MKRLLLLTAVALFGSSAHGADYHITVQPDYRAALQAEVWADVLHNSRYAAGQQIVINPFCVQPSPRAFCPPPVTPDEYEALSKAVGPFAGTKVEVVVGVNGKIVYIRRTPATPEELRQRIVVQ